MSCNVPSNRNRFSHVSSIRPFHNWQLSISFLGIAHRPRCVAYLLASEGNLTVSKQELDGTDAIPARKVNYGLNISLIFLWLVNWIDFI